MLVRFLGFSFSANTTTNNLNEYVDHMITKHNQAHKLGEHNRFLFFNKTHSEKYYVGLLVTVKDQKTFCELTSKSGKWVVKVNELDIHSNLMDFNFFVLHKTTGFGMYQHYHQSCSVNSFGYYNNRRFSEYQESKAKAEIAAIPEHELTTAKERAIKQKHKDYLKWEIIVRKEKLKDLIEELTRVKSFEYSFAAITVEEPEFKPLKQYVKKERKILAFSPTSPVNLLANAITSIVSRNNIDSGKVIGVDCDGIDRVLRITDNPDNYGEYAYDDVATKINALDVTEFEKSWVIQELLNKCVEYSHIFEAKVQ